MRPLFSSGMLLGELLRHGEDVLQATSSSARLDSEVLLACVLGTSRTKLLVALRDECSEEVATQFLRDISRRAAGEPVAYITGYKEFWGLLCSVSPAVLVPRPESELIVERALALLESIPAPRILDLGTGSGCLVVAISRELCDRGERQFHCDAVDRSAQALAVARSNAERHGVGHYISWVESDWFSNREALSPPYDLIIANPPYVDPAEDTPKELSFEPREALFSEDQGLRDVKSIISTAFEFLNPRGVLLVEVGAGKRGALIPFLDTMKLSYRFLGDDSVADNFTIVEARATE